MKTLKTSVFLLFTCYLFFSCKKSSSISDVILPEKQTDQEVISLYSKVGDLHNEGLDVIYTKLRAIADAKIVTGNPSSHRGTGEGSSTPDSI